MSSKITFGPTNTAAHAAIALSKIGPPDAREP